jgi:hypothetical protein
MKSRIPSAGFTVARLLAVSGALLLAIVTHSPLRAQAAGGTVSGSINNAATGDRLEGARVALPKLGLMVLTDNTGRFVLAGVPAGTHELVAT